MKFEVIYVTIYPVMPIFEYECQQCNKISSFLEPREKRFAFWPVFFKPKLKCEACGSKNLKRILSTFAVDSRKSTADSLNDISKMGNVNFVPQSPRPTGPPPGGCPYAQPPAKAKDKKNKIDRIQLS
ncbi:MAG: hypothetical protein KKB82_07735 [Candidatus Omnitrophica bacterium]|nr:hypothetical protein [Candidatus Omnitrophota bacterium]MBU1925793.1 hypothetical protein [Candidatus Omnitrophota bacterium]